MAGKISAKKKRLLTLAKKTAEQKLAILEQLAKCCIIQLACERTSVGRSTYYSWLSEDTEFKEAADKAINAGRAYLNDIAFSGLLKKIQEGNKTMLIFWLKNNHPWFGDKIRHQHEHSVIGVGDRILTDEQREQIVRAYRISGITNAFAQHEILKENFLASPEHKQKHDEVQTPAHTMPDEDRIVDWGTRKPHERMEKELKRNGINIQEFLKKYKKL
jgi:hypothetical protein